MNNSWNKYIRHLPIGFFGSVMALCSLSISWQIAHNLFDYPELPANLLAIVAMADFAILLVAYCIKIFFHWREVKAEFCDDRKVNLFSTIPISCMFIAGVLLTRVPLLANYIWHFGAYSMSIFMIFIIHRWISSKKNNDHAIPEWMLPVTGFIGIPFIGFSFPVRGMSFFSQLSFAGGLLLAITIFVLSISTFFFHQKSNREKEYGAIFILMAPFLMGFLSYIRMREGIDEFASLLYYTGIFLFIVFLPKIFLILRSDPFKSNWWGTVFPVSILSIASQKNAGDQDIFIRSNNIISNALLILSTVLATAVFFHCVFLFLRKSKTSSF